VFIQTDAAFAICRYLGSKFCKKMIKSGDKIPDISLWRINRTTTEEINSSDWFSSGTSVLFMVPGAFTPTCHNHHLPGFIKNASAIKALGVDRIVCASVNDKYVMKAWAKQTGALEQIEFLADFDARFASDLGLSRDLNAGGLGIRFVRAALIIENSIVHSVFVDEIGGQVTNTGALHILDVLSLRRANAKREV